MTTFLKGDREWVVDAIKNWPGPADADPAVYNGTDIEFQTDKQTVKVCPCTADGCGKPIAVNAFYAPAIAKCGGHGGGGERRSTSGDTGGSQIVQAGRTDPSKAARLEDCLINKEFAVATCPFCSTVMELKSVSHNEHYGPGEWVSNGKGGREWRQTAQGETVSHQCNSCRTTLSMSTSAQITYRRMNEPKRVVNRPALEVLLGEREAA